MVVSLRTVFDLRTLFYREHCSFVKNNVR